MTCEVKQFRRGFWSPPPPCRTSQHKCCSQDSTWKLPEQRNSPASKGPQSVSPSLPVLTDLLLAVHPADASRSRTLIHRCASLPCKGVAQVLCGASAQRANVQNSAVEQGPNSYRADAGQHRLTAVFFCPSGAVRACMHSLGWSTSVSNFVQTGHAWSITLPQQHFDASRVDADPDGKVAFEARA